MDSTQSFMQGKHTLSYTHSSSTNHFSLRVESYLALDTTVGKRQEKRRPAFKETTFLVGSAG